VIPPGTLLDGRYEIIAPLASGGMGSVYRARRPLLGDEVAVKVVRALDGASDLAERFLRESRACAQLRHPNIVTILDFNVDSARQPYLVMELLSGPSLSDELALGGPMTPEAVAGILCPVASALQMAHDRGITHRDLKPANIVAHRYESGDRVYKVIDFGLAAVEQVTGAMRLTEPNVFLGTLSYAAPEQLRGQLADARTDIYSLGVIAYEMLTGRRPVDGDDRLAVISQTLTVKPSPPSALRAALSQEIDAVILKALEKDPADRWRSVSEFAGALQRAAGGREEMAGVTSRDALLARYDLGEVLGRGRLGSLVHRGRHRALGLPVAIRVLRRSEQRSWDSARTRFLMEARTLQVSHPNLLHVRDYGEDANLVFLVTDLVDGPSLREALAHGRFSWSRVASLLHQMIDATASLNAHGGFIAGVNPDMIRIGREGGDRERVVMSTAGIATVQDVLATLSEQELRGSEANERELPYVAAEVLLGRPPDAAADVFTLGVLAYEMATGRLPFRAPSLPELIGQMLQAQPADPRALNAEVPEEASRAILHAIRAGATARHPSAAAFGAALGFPS
jgi:serine/threonine protein kinase